MVINTELTLQDCLDHLRFLVYTGLSNGINTIDVVKMLDRFIATFRPELTENEREECIVETCRCYNLTQPFKYQVKGGL